MCEAHVLTEREAQAPAVEAAISPSSGAAGCGKRIRTLAFPNRSRRAAEIRAGIAEIAAGLPQAESEHNGEEGTYPTYPYQANYTKALPKLGTVRADVDPVEYVAAARVLEEARQGLAPDFTDLPLGGIRKHTNPQAGVAFDLEGPDPSAVNLHLFREPARSLRPAPRIDGRDVTGAPDMENAAEMIELYWMALMLDVHFSNYRTTGAPVSPPAGWPAGNLAQQAANELDPLKDAFKERYPRTGGTVTPANLFRGSAPGDNVGPYISQFLLRGSTLFDATISPPVVRRPEQGVVSHGTQSMSQQQVTVVPFKDYLRDVASWRAVQDGTVDPSGTDDYENPLTPRFIRNLRDLGNWVHLDYLYQHFLNAALILLNETVPPTSLGGPPPMARFPVDPGNPYAPSQPDSVNQTGGATFGAPHVLTLLAEVTTRALKAAWYQKWYVHRRDRPEEFGGLVHFQRAAEDSGTPRADGPYPCLDPTILDAPVLDLIFQRNGIGMPPGAGTYLLPQLFPEGSPTHPSYPAGHATVAGACATILKAFFDENADLTDPDPANTIPTNPSRLPPAFVADAAGTALIRAPAPEQVRLQVGGELNKLASNIAIGRDGAGVHWRSDSTQGMALGEAVAAGLLFEQAFTVHELHALSFTTFFTGETVTIGRERPITGDEVFVRITDASSTILLDERYPADF